MPVDSGWCDIEWLHPDGRPMLEQDWNSNRQLALLFSTHPDQRDDSPIVEAVAILFNASDREVEFALPYGLPECMEVRFSSTPGRTAAAGAGCWSVGAHSILLLTGETDA